jgi:signal transduction histidine kinase
MEDLSLHILDIVENSVNAGARNVMIRLVEHTTNGILRLQIDDDGKGMDEEFVKNATDPFVTTKQGKKFGLGLALLSQASKQAGCDMRVEKRAARGTSVIATFDRNHIDMKPIGDIDTTLRVLKATHPEVNFSFDHLIKNGDTA